MDLRPERGQHAQLPVTQLVAETLDHNLAVGREYAAGGFLLLLHVLTQVAHRQSIQGKRRMQCVIVHSVKRAYELTDGPPQLVRPAQFVTVPERHLARHSRRRGDNDLVGGDVFNTPCGRPQQKRFSHPAFVDHLLVQFTHPAPLRRGDCVQPAIGDGAATGDRQHARPRAGPQLTAEPVPGDAWLELGKLI